MPGACAQPTAVRLEPSCLPGLLPPRVPAFQNLRDHRADRDLLPLRVGLDQLRALGGDPVSRELNCSRHPSPVWPDRARLPRPCELAVVGLAEALRKAGAPAALDGAGGGLLLGRGAFLPRHRPSRVVPGSPRERFGWSFMERAFPRVRCAICGDTGSMRNGAPGEYFSERQDPPCFQAFPAPAIHPVFTRLALHEHGLRAWGSAAPGCPRWRAAFLGVSITAIQPIGG